MIAKAINESVAAVEDHGRAPKWKTAILLTAGVGLAAAIFLGISIAASPLPAPLILSEQETGLHFAAFSGSRNSRTLDAHAAAEMINWPNRNIAISREIRIGMIDGDVNVNHPALKGQNIVRRDFRRGKALTSPMNHGTAVATILVGNETSSDFKGLLPNATLYAANIFSLDARGRIFGDPVAFLRAVDWLIEMDVSVINVSLTGKDNLVIRSAVAKAVRHGVIVVAAAGNNRGVSGRDYPAAYDGVLAATAVDAGLAIYPYASHGSHVDFSAPGVSLLMAANHGSQVLSGTSFAAPFLTAAASIAVHDNRQSDVDSVRHLLSAHARDLGQAGNDRVFGYGLIDCNDHADPRNTGQSVGATGPVPAGPRLIARN